MKKRDIALAVISAFSFIVGLCGYPRTIPEPEEIHVEETVIDAAVPEDMVIPVYVAVQEQTVPEETIPAYTLDKSITLEEFELMCRIVMNESGGEPYQTQVAVAETIINRVNSDRFPNTVIQVLYQPYQYSHHQNGGITDSVKEAVKQALEYHTYDTDMVYFREDYYHEFAEDYFYINNMYFSKGGH